MKERVSAVIRLDEEVADKIKELAKADYRKPSEYARMVIMKAIEKENEDESAR